MEKGQIRKLNKELSQELLDAQEYFIYEAENHTDFYLQNYIESPSSYRGHYICADLFKEMFQKYTESIDTRKKYFSYYDIKNITKKKVDYTIPSQLYIKNFDTQMN